jgi:hypothetical protein
MTRPGSTATRNTLRDLVNRRARELEKEGRIAKTERVSPARTFRLTPGWQPVYVKVHDPEGKPRDQQAALAFLAGRPYAHLLVYKGVSRGMHVCEFDPKALAEGR